MAHLSHNLKATVQHLGPFAMFVAETYLLDHVVTQRIYTKYTSAGPFTSHSLKMIMNAQLPPQKSLKTCSSEAQELGEVLLNVGTLNDGKGRKIGV